LLKKKIHYKLLQQCCLKVVSVISGPNKNYHKPFHCLVISITHYKNWLITTNNTKKQRLVWGFYIL